MSEEVATAYGDMRELTQLRAALEAAQATQAALESQLGQAHEATLLAQADAETLLNAVRYATQADTLEERLRGWGALCNLARDAHPGTPLADEVRAAQADVAAIHERVGLFASQLEMWGYATVAGQVRGEILTGPVVVDVTLGALLIELDATRAIATAARAWRTARETLNGIADAETALLAAVAASDQR